MKSTKIIFSTIAIFTLCSCGDGNKVAEETLVTDTTSVKVDSAAAKLDEEKEFKFYTVIANIPSPAHEVTAIKDAGFKYNSAFCHSLENESKYSTTLKTALNYGIYSSDLAYTATFANQSDIMKRFVTTRKIAEKAGVVGVFDEIVKNGHFEENLKNSDSLNTILDQVYISIEKFCQTDHHLDIATKITVGSMIESHYLALAHLKDQKLSKKNEVLYKSVWEGKLHLSNIVDLLKEYDANKELTQLQESLSTYLTNYDKVTGTADLSTEKINKMFADISAIRSWVTE